MSTTERGMYAFCTCTGVILQARMNALLFNLDAVFKRMRRELYDKLASCFPQSMAQPKDNLVDLIKLK